MTLNDSPQSLSAETWQDCVVEAQDLISRPSAACEYVGLDDGGRCAVKEDEFKTWLAEGGAQSEAGRKTRAYAVRGIESKLAGLGSPYVDLDVAWRADRFAHLRQRLKEMQEDFLAGGSDYRMLMPQSEKPLNRLASWRSWLGQYGQFLSGEQRGERDADRIRRHVLETYIEPARENERETVEVLVRDVNDALGLKDSWPDICQALCGRKFLEMADVPFPGRIGADQSSATRFCYDLVRPSFSDQIEAGTEVEQQPMRRPTNLILYGPPGTGKTYATAHEAVQLCDGNAPYSDDEMGRRDLMKRYRELKAEGRLDFVTFHQSYDYESFVEGMRPETGNEEGGIGFRLEVNLGIFREICALAEQARTRPIRAAADSELDLAGRQFWKMGLGTIGSEDDVYENAVAENYIALGWSGAEDWSEGRFASMEAIKAHWLSKERESAVPSNWTQTHKFRNEMKRGDIVIVPYGNSAFRAVAEVQGNYEFDSSTDGYYSHRRNVRWLLTLDEPLPLDTIVDGNFTMRTLYQLPGKRINTPALSRLLSGEAVPISPNSLAETPQQFVLIIDEINRANISKVFGELITLLEPDKRLGMPNALTLTLPYSKKDFGVPANLHIIGTMNTADRSIALLDTALRRRFAFREMAPKAELLGTIDGIDLKSVITTINDRIEYLVDREHRIGHAFFMGCANRDEVDAVMRDKVIPLLQEYFFEDWSRIRAVLGDGFIGKRMIKAPPGIDGGDRESWIVRDSFTEDAYTRLLSNKASSAEVNTPAEDQLNEPQGDAA